MRLDARRRQWLDLGIHIDVCLTDPDSCYSGAAMAMWMRVESGDGIITTKHHENGRGFNLATATFGNVIM